MQPFRFDRFPSEYNTLSNYTKQEIFEELNRTESSLEVAVNKLPSLSGNAYDGMLKFIEDKLEPRRVELLREINRRASAELAKLPRTYGKRGRTVR